MKQLLALAILVLSVGCAGAVAERNPCFEDEVEVAALIDSTGHVKSVTVLKGSACPELDEVAIRTAREEVYVPATRNGQPVSSALKYKIRFKPTGEPIQPETDVRQPR